MRLKISLFLVGMSLISGGCTTPPQDAHVEDGFKLTTMLSQGKTITTADVSVWVECDLLVPSVPSLHIVTKIQNHSKRAFEVFPAEIKVQTDNGRTISSPWYFGTLQGKNLRIESGKSFDERDHDPIQLQPKETVEIRNSYPLKMSVVDELSGKSDRSIKKLVIQYAALKDEKGNIPKLGGSMRSYALILSLLIILTGCSFINPYTLKEDPSFWKTLPSDVDLKASCGDNMESGTIQVTLELQNFKHDPLEINDAFQLLLSVEGNERRVAKNISYKLFQSSEVRWPKSYVKLEPANPKLSVAFGEILELSFIFEEIVKDQQEYAYKLQAPLSATPAIVCEKRK